MHLLVLTDGSAGGKCPLPSLEFLDHALAYARLNADSVGDVRQADLVVVDATTNLAAASHACRTLTVADMPRPILLVVGEGGLAALKPGWGFDDWLLPSAQPAEVETRLRLLLERTEQSAPRGVAVGELSIDEETYVVRLRGRPLDLTYREFALLKYLADNAGRVFTRAHLLQEVWGYDYFGGTRTVDVHIRRLRAKLGPEHEQLIGTVRGVGYKLDPHGLRGDEGSA